MTSSANRSGPLKGLRAIELGSTIAGPFCTRLLADFGADVIKVEQPEGDAVRSMGTQREGCSLYGASIFRNKRLMSVDLRQQAGRDLVRRLCVKADIVVENFRPGTLERWGLGYDELSRENPGLILVRISGFGQDGPYSDRGGYGVVGEAVSGLRGITGDADRPPPRVATSLTDYIAGLYAAFGVVMAVVERHGTGKGQVVDAALYEAAFSFMEPHIPAYQQLGVIARRAGSRLPGNTPNSLYATSDGRHVVIAAASDAVFARLAAAIGRPELADDPRFSTGIARTRHQDDCDAAITAWTSRTPIAEVEAALQEAKVPAARIYTVEDIFGDAHYRHREMLVDLPDPELGMVTLAGVVPKMSRTPGSVWRSGPRIGEDTCEVLKNELKLTQVEIDALERNGTVRLLEPSPGKITTPNQH
jgi:crotonobetainyl-CoA:carnitine CoA-transferase CaiB-like acyl-CoA transferase